jgi:hypothetical protein
LLVHVGNVLADIAQDRREFGAVVANELAVAREDDLDPLVDVLHVRRVLQKVHRQESQDANGKHENIIINKSKNNKT